MLERSSVVKGEPVLYADCRLGGAVQLVYGPLPGGGVRVPDAVKQCICYVCSRTGAGQWHYGGTAFFLLVPFESVPDRGFVYVVTARHCVEHAEQSGSDAFLRVNTMAGGATFIQIDTTWHYPDSGADVALLLLTLPEAVLESMDFKCLPWSICATEEVIQKEDIGIGEDLLTVGLFSMRRGTQRNYPIVREGIIASMPDEPLEDRATGKPYEAYLAEVRSIGGLSGSPVFVVLHTGRLRQGAIVAGGPTLYLLGLIRGHWDLKAQSMDLAFAHQELEAVNMGIAVVTPIKEVEALLFSEELVKERRRREATWKLQNDPTPD